MLVYKVTFQAARGETTAKTKIRPNASNERIFLTSVNAGKWTFCQLCAWNKDAKTEFKNYLKKRKINGRELSRKEITAKDLKEILLEGSKSGLCPEYPSVVHRAGFWAFYDSPLAEELDETLLDESWSPKQAQKRGKALHSKSLDEEITRIVGSTEQKFNGYPVIYAIVGEHLEDTDDIFTALHATLRGCGRLPSARICMPKFQEECVALDADPFCRAMIGGVVYLRAPYLPDERDSLDAARKTFSTLSKEARERRDKLLTVFGLTEETERFLESIKESAGASLFVIKQDRMTRTQAGNLLRSMARERGLHEMPSNSCLPKNKADFSKRETQEVFERWYDKHLLTRSYPLYAPLLEDQQQSDCSKETAFQHLDDLIGLSEVKIIVRQANDYAKMQQMCRKRGLSEKMPLFHMAFTGNPGTAKTTVARLTAEILRDSGILSVGKLIEVGRADLVEKYVGWTAKRVKTAFQEAKGSVLFIDEAYSLLDGQRASFGVEAINTIVQEMENHRDDTVVIFAGYQNEMKKFLESNAGLDSRITFHVNFPDYTENELMDIFRKILRENKRFAAEPAEEKVRGLIRAAMKRPNFGNGRYIRSLVERAVLSQASRLMSLSELEISNDDLLNLTAADFVDVSNNLRNRTIGFAV